MELLVILKYLLNKLKILFKFKLFQEIFIYYYKLKS